LFNLLIDSATGICQPGALPTHTFFHQNQPITAKYSGFGMNLQQRIICRVNLNAKNVNADIFSQESL